MKEKIIPGVSQIVVKKWLVPFVGNVEGKYEIADTKVFRSRYRISIQYRFRASLFDKMAERPAIYREVGTLIVVFTIIFLATKIHIHR